MSELLATDREILIVALERARDCAAHILRDHSPAAHYAENVKDAWYHIEAALDRANTPKEGTP